MTVKPLWSLSICSLFFVSLAKTQAGYLRRSQSLSRESTITQTRKRSIKAHDDVEELFLKQSLNHYDEGDDRVFQQRYFRTERYLLKDQETGKESFSFLCVGGEGPSLDKSVLIDSPHCSGDMLELASRLFEEGHSVNVYALEHRYYGQSYPEFSDSPVTNKNLRFLSSEQALADLAHFVSSKTTLSTSQKWVTFGGSYPGMLAAWARYKYPHLIYGAVSSSAPVQAQLDFGAYKNHIGSALADVDVRGSLQCLDIFRNGHEQLIQMVSDEKQHQELRQVFQLCETTDLSVQRNAELFLGEGVVNVYVQGNDPACTQDLCNIAKICQTLINAKQNNSDVGALATVAREQLKNSEEDCVELNWESDLKTISDTELGMEGGWRSWLWQTCTEFGFYQTCEYNSTCPFGQGMHNVDQDLEICLKAFGRTPEQVAGSVRSTLERYGGWKLSTTRILSVTGDVDPWSELAIRTRHNNDLPAYSVPGASHHFWTHSVKDTDDSEISKAREIIYETVSEWLQV